MDFTDEETATWKEAYVELSKLYKTMACQEHLDGLRLLEENCERSGFRLRPVGGLLTPRDFLASLAFRVFQCTQYIRHHTQPLHTPEPDSIHELLGHMPMLTNLEFAEFSQAIGLASLGASDSEIERLATLYWFTVEFGLCKQNGEIKAYGAGLLSAYGELEHALGPTPERRPFRASETALTKYQDLTYQPIYFVTESIQDMKKQLKDYTKNINKAFQATYDPYTESILILNEKNSIDQVVRWINNEINIISLAIK
ncbi:hypothetical protein Ciccas_007760 [Cichlidogyrus casuarinus]|uniref:Biopterin-dependent aromatic amino acid hydroxylase family profile domain-containing protein n=1 Tax=Cichlidogyrus casuarinus TaxID=1844966 RepID=A0ABD2Q214_9PLAT